MKLLSTWGLNVKWIRLLFEEFLLCLMRFVSSYWVTLFGKNAFSCSSIFKCCYLVIIFFKFFCLFQFIFWDDAISFIMWLCPFLHGPFPSASTGAKSIRAIVFIKTKQKWREKRRTDGKTDSGQLHGLWSELNAPHDEMLLGISPYLYCCLAALNGAT